MCVSVTVKKPGLLSTIQDQGRRGLRHLGIPWSGCISPTWQKVANALVGNELEQSIIECWEGGLHLEVGEHPVRLAVCAHETLNMTIVDSQGHSQKIIPWQSYTAPVGSSITLSTTGDFRHAVVALHGIDVPAQLGSTSTYVKASLGGLHGAALQEGNELVVKAAPLGPELMCTASFADVFTQTEVRLILGPQHNNFSSKGIHNLLHTQYELGTDADRMGVRLTGPNVEHKDEASKDIVSDAIVPGSIQVPGSGQPIVLLSDAHTAGGYAKVATVLSIDLPLFGLHRAGTKFRFRSLSIDDAISAVRSDHLRVEKALKTLRPAVRQTLSSEALLNLNLIDGVTDGNPIEFETPGT